MQRVGAAALPLLFATLGSQCGRCWVGFPPLSTLPCVLAAGGLSPQLPVGEGTADRGGRGGDAAARGLFACGNEFPTWEGRPSVLGELHLSQPCNIVGFKRPILVPGRPKVFDPSLAAWEPFVFAAEVVGLNALSR